MHRTALIVTSGVPGTGKSTLANGIAGALPATILAKDVVEAALLRRGIGREENSFWISHEVITSVAREHLRNGQHVVLDTVATTEDVRSDWRELARTEGSVFVVFHCVCEDLDLHRSRIVGRDRGIEGWAELEWADVERVMNRFEPWSDAHLVLEACESPQFNLQRALDYVRHRVGSTA